MVDAKQLAGTLSGMSPEQAAKTAQMNVRALQTEQQLGQQQQRIDQQQLQFEQQQKLQQMNMALQAAIERRKMNLKDRQLAAEEAYRTQQSDLMKQQADKLRFENQMMDQLSEQTVETKLGPMRGDLAMGYHSLGMPIFTPDSKLQWKVETIDNKTQAVIMDGQGQISTKVLGEATEEADTAKRLKAAEDSILADFGVSSFSGLEEDVRPVARTANELAIQMLQNDPDMEGKFAANQALWTVERQKDQLETLSATRYSKRHREETIRQLMPLVKAAMEYEDKLKSPLFSGAYLEETLQQSGASQEEATDLLRNAYYRITQGE